MPECGLASILVGDHLGQVRKVLWPSCELSLVPGCAEPDSSNPVVSIEPISTSNRQLIANQNGDLHIFSPTTGQCDKIKTKVEGSLIKALPINQNDSLLLYDKQITFKCGSGSNAVHLKKGHMKNARFNDKSLAVVGQDVPLRLFDVDTKNKIYEAAHPDKDWLGVRPECYVVGVDFVGQHHVATCSKSDSVIRVYDTRSAKQCKPVIEVDHKQTAFNEHAEAGRFVSISAPDDGAHKLVVGSNVGQIIAIDLRLNKAKTEVPKKTQKKKFQPRSYKILGSFKEARGATIKDIKIVQATKLDGDEAQGYKVITCCLDRYLRIHNFSQKSRQLDKHVYIKTKPICCAPIFYQ